MALSMMNSDMILKSCKVMMTCVRAIPSFIKYPGYNEQSSRTVNDKPYVSDVEDGQYGRNVL